LVFHSSTHSEYVTLEILLFHCNSGCTNMLQCYVILTLAVLFMLLFNYSSTRAPKLLEL